MLSCEQRPLPSSAIRPCRYSVLEPFQACTGTAIASLAVGMGAELAPTREQTGYRHHLTPGTVTNYTTPASPRIAPWFRRYSLATCCRFCMLGSALAGNASPFGHKRRHPRHRHNLARLTSARTKLRLPALIRRRLAFSQVAGRSTSELGGPLVSRPKSSGHWPLSVAITCPQCVAAPQRAAPQPITRRCFVFVQPPAEALLQGRLRLLSQLRTAALGLHPPQP